MTSMSRARRGVLASLLAIGTAATLAACSSGSAGSASGGDADFPRKTVEIVVPYAAGGLTDIAARALAAGMEEELGQTVIVLNKEGASAITGTTEAAMARPDGYKIAFVVDNALAQSEIRDTAYSYDSFEPVSAMFSQPYVLVASAESGYTSFADVTELDSVTYGVSGIANPQHLNASVLFDDLGIPATAVPFDGTAPLTQALIGNNVSIALHDASAVAPYLASGELVALAALTPDGEPIAEMPDVPTFGDLGVETQEMVLPIWGVIVPAGVPAEVLDTLRQAVAAASATPEYTSLLEKNGMPVVETDADEWYEQTRKAGATVKALIEKFDIQIG